MTTKSRIFAKTWQKARIAILALLLLNSATGCAKRYVVIEGGETVTVNKSDLTELYEANEDLLNELEECRNK